jgi:hypothetical protein
MTAYFTRIRQSQNAVSSRLPGGPGAATHRGRSGDVVDRLFAPGEDVRAPAGGSRAIAGQGWSARVLRRRLHVRIGRDVWLRPFHAIAAHLDVGRAVAGPVCRGAAYRHVHLTRLIDRACRPCALVPRAIKKPDRFALHTRRHVGDAAQAPRRGGSLRLWRRRRLGRLRRDPADSDAGHCCGSCRKTSPPQSFRNTR